jgi:hypothetical protein
VIEGHQPATFSRNMLRSSNNVQQGGTFGVTLATPLRCSMLDAPSDCHTVRSATRYGCWARCFKVRAIRASCEGVSMHYDILWCDPVGN